MVIWQCARSMIQVEWKDLECRLGEDMCRGRDWLTEEKWSGEQACCSGDCNGERGRGWNSKRISQSEEKEKDGHSWGQRGEMRVIHRGK